MGRTVSEKKSYVGCFTAVDRLIKDCRKCEKTTLILSSCFNPGSTSAHARLLLLSRNENDFSLTIYDPMEKENLSVGSSAKDLAKKLKIRSVRIATGTQTIEEKNCVQRCMEKAINLMGEKTCMRTVATYDIVKS